MLWEVKALLQLFCVADGDGCSTESSFRPCTYFGVRGCGPVGRDAKPKLVDDFEVRLHVGRLRPFHETRIAILQLVLDHMGMLSRKSAFATAYARQRGVTHIRPGSCRLGSMLETCSYGVRETITAQEEALPQDTCAIPSVHCLHCRHRRPIDIDIRFEQPLASRRSRKQIACPVLFDIQGYLHRCLASSGLYRSQTSTTCNLDSGDTGDIDSWGPRSH
ncbi:hypothetical protein BV25DRAFT_497142 [Artomyces pyxidatus]|uniref:Uncharacterized protein n=1 Tax=Artomyces pyxidatus TaxID=48021 RepID=A0ACB8T4I6_9AGAM|nr:hypothetical protein BV25DRAFT_497142 [Artomyces pyxidatus]